MQNLIEERGKLKVIALPKEFPDRLGCEHVFGRYTSS